MTTTWKLHFIIFALGLPSTDTGAVFRTKEACYATVHRLVLVVKMKHRRLRYKNHRDFMHHWCSPEYDWESD